MKLANDIGGFMPKSKLGKWSVWLIPAMVILFLIGLSLPTILYKSVPAGDSPISDIMNRPALAISMLLGFGAGCAAFVTGLISIIKKKERAFFVYVCTLIGAVVIVLSIPLFLFPD
jgi:undecaprenyl pyrophosphate phosphatase UppP